MGRRREHAPWALLDFGIRCVISTSFADIFYNNCFKNGILPIVVTPEQLEMLLDDAERGSNATLTVDLEAQTISGPDGGTIHFDIDPGRKQVLLEGLDDIAMTLKKDETIPGSEGKMAENRPWVVVNWSSASAQARRSRQRSVIRAPCAMARWSMSRARPAMIMLLWRCPTIPAFRRLMRSIRSEGCAGPGRGLAGRRGAGDLHRHRTAYVAGSRWSAVRRVWACSGR